MVSILPSLTRSVKVPFSHRAKVVYGPDGNGKASGDPLLHLVFINSGPGVPLPDLIDFNAAKAVALEGSFPGEEIKLHVVGK
jgi:hypothetical protein